MFASVWLLLSGLFYSLQLHSGSFPKPLTSEEERHYLARAAQGDLEARNILVERIAIGKCNGKRIGRLSDKSPFILYWGNLLGRLDDCPYQQN